MAKVLCKPRFQNRRFEIPCFENPHFGTGRCVTGQFKSARIGPYSKGSDPLDPTMYSAQSQLQTHCAILMKLGV